MPASTCPCALVISFFLGFSIAAVAQSDATIVDGSARFQILSPSLIRLEYASDGVFEDRPTFNALNRDFPKADFSTRVEDNWRVIETEQMILRYQSGTGPFSAKNLSLVVREYSAVVHPIGCEPSTAEASGPEAVDTVGAGPIAKTSALTGARSVARNLGGWTASLDRIDRPIPLNDGLLTREGWYYLDDTKTSPWTKDRWIEPRASAGVYQDGYLFVYGSHFKEALRELAILTGPAPLPPRWAFGVWYSRYSPYTSDDYRQIVGQFRSRRVPLDVLVIDTDFKSPNSWNGWGWNTGLFPDPKGFISWLHAQGLKVTLNIHANIMADDPKFSETQAAVNQTLIDAGPAESFDWIKAKDGRLPVVPGTHKYLWDWTRRDHSKSYFALHEPFERDGVDFWWLDDWNDVNWVNHLYAQRLNDKGERPVFMGRIKGMSPWAEHRSTIHFTGDTLPTWELIDFIPFYTAREGNVGIPYITHDIGSHLGVSLPDDLYLRWVQLGTFLPILRLHSCQREAIRLPWEFKPETEEVATTFLRLREALVPYIYSVASQSHRTGLPMVRGMYLDYPKDERAYTFDRQYMFGDQMLIAPITSPGDPARKDIWMPPGRWINFFTGETYTGLEVHSILSRLTTVPAFVKAGGIIPLYPYADTVGGKTPDLLIIRVFPGANGRFELYEDAGAGLMYQSGEYATSLFEYTDGPEKSLRQRPTSGSFSGQSSARAYRLEFINCEKPKSVSLDGTALAAASEGQGWSYDAKTSTLVVNLDSIPIRKGMLITHDGATVSAEPNKQ